MWFKAIVAVVACMLFAGSVQAAPPPVAPPVGAPPSGVPGGRSNASPSDPGVVAAAKFAAAAVEKIMKNDGKAKKVSLVRVVRAESQVVAGMMFSLWLQLKVDGRNRNATAKVWAKPGPQFKGNYALQSWGISGDK